MKRLIAGMLVGTLTTSPAYALRAEGPQSSGLEELERDLGGRPINRRALLQWAIGVALGGSAIGGGMSWSVRASDLARLRDTRQALETLPWGFPGSASANIIPVPDTHQGKLGALYRIDLFDKTGHPAKAPYGYLLLNLQHARPELITIALCAFEDAPLGSNMVQQITKQTLTLDRRQLEALSSSTPDGRRQACVALRLDQSPLEARSFQHLAMWIFAEPGTSRAAPLSAIVYTDLALQQQHLSEEQVLKIRSLAEVSVDSARSLVPPTLLGGAVGLLAGIGVAAAFDEALREYLRSFVSAAPGPSAAPAAGTLPAVPLRHRGQEMVNDFARNAEAPKAVVVLSDPMAKQLSPILERLRVTPLTYRYRVLPKAVGSEGLSPAFVREIVDLEKDTQLPVHLYGDRGGKVVAAAEAQLKRFIPAPEIVPTASPRDALASFLHDIGVPGGIATPDKVLQLMEATGMIAHTVEQTGLEEPSPVRRALQKALLPTGDLEEWRSTRLLRFALWIVAGASVGGSVGSRVAETPKGMVVSSAVGAGTMGGVYIVADREMRRRNMAKALEDALRLRTSGVLNKLDRGQEGPLRHRLAAHRRKIEAMFARRNSFGEKFRSSLIVHAMPRDRLVTTLIRVIRDAQYEGTSLARRTLETSIAVRPQLALGVNDFRTQPAYTRGVRAIRLALALSNTGDVALLQRLQQFLADRRGASASGLEEKPPLDRVILKSARGKHHVRYDAVVIGPGAQVTSLVMARAYEETPKPFRVIVNTPAQASAIKALIKQHGLDGHLPVEWEQWIIIIETELTSSVVRKLYERLVDQYRGGKDYSVLFVRGATDPVVGARNVTTILIQNFVNRKIVGPRIQDILLAYGLTTALPSLEIIMRELRQAKTGLEALEQQY